MAKSGRRLRFSPWAGNGRSDVIGRRLRTHVGPTTASRTTFRLWPRTRLGWPAFVLSRDSTSHREESCDDAAQADGSPGRKGGDLDQRQLTTTYRDLGDREARSGQRPNPLQKAARLQIAASVVEFDIVNPLLVDEAGVIIAGHGRLLAAKSLNMAKILVIEIAGLSDAPGSARCFWRTTRSPSMPAGTWISSGRSWRLWRWRSTSTWG